MKDRNLQDLLKEWESTWERPGAKEYFSQLGRIVLMVILLLIIVYSCERLKENESVDQHIEAKQIKKESL